MCPRSVCICLHLLDNHDLRSLRTQLHCPDFKPSRPGDDGFIRALFRAQRWNIETNSTPQHNTENDSNQTQQNIRSDRRKWHQFPEWPLSNRERYRPPREYVPRYPRPWTRDRGTTIQEIPTQGDVCGGIRNPTDNYQLVLTEILPGWRTRCGPEFEWTRGMRQGGALWRCSFTQATTQSLRRRNKEDIVGVNLKALIFIVKMLVLLHADCKSILAFCFKRSHRHLLFVKFS